MKKFRLLALVLAAVTCLSAFSTLAVSAADYDAAYDVNGDEMVNTKDLTRLMKFIAGDNVTAASTDINGDGTVNTKDLTRLMKYIAGESGGSGNGGSGSGSAYVDNFNALKNWILENGTYDSANSWSQWVSGAYTEDNGSPYIISFTYHYSTGMLELGLAYLSTASEEPRYGLMDATSVFLSPGDNIDGYAAYIFSFDVESQLDFLGYYQGELGIASYAAGSDLSYADRNLGGWDSNYMDSYLVSSMTFAMYNFDYELSAQNVGVSLYDLGFVSFQ